MWTVAAAGAAVLATGGVALASTTPSVSGQIRASGDVTSVTAQHLDPSPNFMKRN